MAKKKKKKAAIQHTAVSRTTDTQNHMIARNDIYICDIYVYYQRNYLLVLG